MGTHPIFESDFDCLTECGLKRSPVLVFFSGLVYVGTFGLAYWENSGKHKGPFAGGAPYMWGNGARNTGTKVPHQGMKNRFEHLIDNHIYGRTMQMCLEQQRTEWIHPALMPVSMQLQKQSSESA